MKINLKAFCLIGIILILNIKLGLCTLCNHSGPPGPNDPTPNPHRSHRHPCCNPNVPLECPCPDCEALFENKEDLKSHIIRNHAGCHYAIEEYVRGDSCESCGGDYDDRHLPYSSEYDEESYSSGEENPQDRLCQLGICPHDKHKVPQWAQLDSKKLNKEIDKAIPKKLNPPSSDSDEAVAPGPQLDRPSTSKDTRISIPCPPVCIDLTGDTDSDDSIEFIPLPHDNSIKIIDETNLNQIKPNQRGSRPTTNNEIYLVSSDEEEGTWKASNGKTYCLPKRKRKKQKSPSTTNPSEGDNFSKHYSSSTQGPEGPGSNMMSSGAVIGGMICQLVVTTSTHQRHPRSVNDRHQLTVSGSNYWNLFSEQVEHLMASSTLGQRMPSSVGWHCEALTPKPVKTWRDDFRCRGKWLTESGDVAGCNPDNDSAHCCSEYNYCGSTRDHCHGPGSVDYRDYTTRIRKEDNSCGFGHLSPSGLVAICDPHSDKPCCSQYGKCGGEEKFCRGGTDFRKVSKFTETRRKDGLCGYGHGGRPYIAKDGKTAICSKSECCSLFNFCGEGREYCWRGTNFTAMSDRELEKFRSQ